jgi:predicted DNA-binding transcriptional regulator YafY
MRTTIAETAQRLFALLALLQSRPDWTSPELASRLYVTTRTIRVDVERLRSLGYPIHSRRGRAGGYRLGAGGMLPPLLLDDEEAIAVAVGVHAASGVAGIRESSNRALVKLEQILPPRLRATVDALRSSAERAPENVGTDAPDPEIDPATLGAVAAAIRNMEWLRFDYAGTARVVEPYRLLSWQRRWYLVARDASAGAGTGAADQADSDRTGAGWHILRVDGMELRMPTRRRFTPRSFPGGDYVSFVMRNVASSGWKVHARLRIAAPAQTVLDRINPTVGAVAPIDDDSCLLLTGADSLDTVAAYIGMLQMDFTVESPPELIPALAAIARRYERSVRDSNPLA